MRITGGVHRSRKLFTPKGDAVRPTSDKIRQAVFNMLNARGVLVDAVVIDAFCGTGALGLEALSQGASSAIFFDKSKDSIVLTKSNIETLGEQDRAHVIFGDVTKGRVRPENMPLATLVFLDPPYRMDLVDQAIKALRGSGWLAVDCFFVVETAKDEVIDTRHIEILAEKIYGDTKVILAELKAPDL